MTRVVSYTVFIATIGATAPRGLAAPNTTPTPLAAPEADQGAGANPGAQGRLARDDERVLAQAALAEGNRLFNDGDLAGAIVAYRRAQALLPEAATKLEFNIGKAEEGRGNEPAAAAAFERFLADGTVGSAEFREEARSTLARLAAGLGALKLSEQKPGLIVSVDGEVRGTTPVTDVWVRPGHHTLTLTDGDRLVFRDDFAVEPGASVQVTVTVRPRAGGGEAPSRDPSGPVNLQPPPPSAAGLGVQLGDRAADDGDHGERPVWKRWWFWAASAAVLAGTVAAVVILTRNNDCPSGYTCGPIDPPGSSP